MGRIRYLQDHFDCKDAGEGVIKVVEDLVPETALLHRILGCQGYAAQGDDYHDEEIKVRQIDYPVGSTPNPVKTKEQHKAQSISNGRTGSGGINGTQPTGWLVIV